MFQQSERFKRLLFIVGSCLICIPQSSADQPKNIVLIVADDLGRDLGCYGNRAVHTPHLDQFASEGTLFTHAFCNSPNCSASRSVILSGLYNHSNGQYGDCDHRSNFQTHRFVRGLPILLSRAGYRTCSIGKFHVKPETVYHFDEYVNHATMEHRHVDQMVGNATQFLSSDQPQPFFLYFCPGDPHRTSQGFGNEIEYPGIPKKNYSPDDVIVPKYLSDTKSVREELADYYQAINRMDRGVGRLLQAIKKHGHWDNTLILFLSDHGCSFPGAKNNLYDPGIRIPLIAHLPNQHPNGIKNTAMISCVDIVPTILEFADVKPPRYSLHGRSFLSLIKQTEGNGWDEVFASHSFDHVNQYYPMRMIRTRRYKYIFNAASTLPVPISDELVDSKSWKSTLETKLLGERKLNAFINRPEHELYDLETDPHELTNLANDPNHQAVLSQMQTKLKTWRENTNDPWFKDAKFRDEKLKQDAFNDQAEE